MKRPALFLLISLLAIAAVRPWATFTPKAGGLTLLETQTASSSAALNFTTCITSTYDDYMIEIVNVVPESDAVLKWRASTNGGSSYNSGSNYKFQTTYVASNNTSGIDTSNGATSATLGGTIEASSSPGGSGSYRLFNPGGAQAAKQMVGALSYLSSDGNYYDQRGGSQYVSGTAVNAFQILMSSGNIASGTARCYGVTK